MSPSTITGRKSPCRPHRSLYLQSHRNSIPSLEERPEWRKRQSLARQTTHAAPPVNEFKAGTWGNGLANKRTIMDAFCNASKYPVGFSVREPSATLSKRRNEADAVHIDDIIHMKSKDNKTHYVGVVTSKWNDLAPDRLFPTFPGLDRSGLAATQDGCSFLVCDVVWTKKLLTDTMKVRLNKLTKNGGGCTRQCGTLIPLA